MALDAQRSQLWGLIGEAGVGGPAFVLIDGPPLAGIEDLIGLTVPDAWAGVAVVMSATATELDTDARHQVRFAYAIDRHGHTATLADDQSGTRINLGVDAEATPTGRLADLTRRMFGLSTHPEPTRPVALALLDWIEELIELATDDDFSGWVDDWAAVADIHPMASISLALTPPELGRTAAADRVTWDELHQTAVDLGLGVGWLSGAEVAWLDGPSMARFIIDSRRPLDAALHAAADVIPPSVFRRVMATIAASDVGVTTPTAEATPE